MHLFWENGELTIYGMVMFFTIFPALASIILILIGHKAGSRAAWTAGMISMSLAVIGFLFPRILNLMDDDMRNALIAASALAAFIIRPGCSRI